MVLSIVLDAVIIIMDEVDAESSWTPVLEEQASCFSERNSDPIE